MFLTSEQLFELTGRKVARAQIEVLRRNGIPFFVTARGHPRVTRVAIEGGAASNAPQATAWTPRLAARR